MYNTYMLHSNIHSCRCITI